jgi:hypothetical protein
MDLRNRLGIRNKRKGSGESEPNEDRFACCIGSDDRRSARSRTADRERVKPDDCETDIISEEHRSIGSCREKQYEKVIYHPAPMASFETPVEFIAPDDCSAFAFRES